jgi:HK97 family phage major capsid protein
VNIAILNDTRDRAALEDEMRRLHAESGRILDAAADEDRDLNLTEKRRLDTINARFRHIERELAIDDGDSEFLTAAQHQENIASRRRVPAEAPWDGTYLDEPGRSSGVVALPQRTPVRPQRAILNYVPGHRVFDTRALFAGERAANDRHPFGDSLSGLVAAMIGSTRAGVMDPRLAQVYAAASTESDPASGGYLVSRMVESVIWDDILGTSDLIALCDVRPLRSGMHSYACFDGMDRSVGGQGGFTTQWVGELGQFTPQKTALRTVELQPKKAGTLVAVSNEMLADAGGFEQQLRGALAANGARELEEKIVAGAGGAQPLGILNSPSLISVTRTTRFANLLTCYAQNFNRVRAVWLIHSTVLPELFQLNFEGTAQSTDLAAGPSVFVQRADGVMTLLGRPVIVTDACAPAASAGDVIFVDLMSYVLGLRQGLQVAISPHIFFDTDQTAIRAILRADGTAKYSEQLKQRDGTTLNSWAVTIAA